MKKMTAFVMALALVCTNVPANLHVQTGTETVYAAQETAINSEQDLIAMQNNPKGKYYLAKDITITKKLNMFPDYQDDNGDYRVDSFMGTLDGKGHKIKNYVGIGLFDNAKNATFKNIIMTNVTIEGTQSAAALVYSAKNVHLPILQYPAVQRQPAQELYFMMRTVILPIVPARSMPISKQRRTFGSVLQESAGEILAVLSRIVRTKEI